MANMVLLHNGTSGGYVLRAEQLTVSLSKTPLQVAIPSATPTILDLNMVRPNLTIGGVVENTTVTGSSISLGTPVTAETSVTAQTLGFNGTYTIPDKNNLEDFFTELAFSSNINLALILMNPDNANFNFYHVAPQTATFTLAPGTEDRYNYNFTMVAGKRNVAYG